MQIFQRHKDSHPPSTIPAVTAVGGVSIHARDKKEVESVRFRRQCCPLGQFHFYIPTATSPTDGTHFDVEACICLISQNNIVFKCKVSFPGETVRNYLRRELKTATRKDKALTLLLPRPNVHKHHVRQESETEEVTHFYM